MWKLLLRLFRIMLWILRTDAFLHSPLEIGKLTGRRRRGYLEVHVGLGFRVIIGGILSRMPIAVT